MGDQFGTGIKTLAKGMRCMLRIISVFLLSSTVAWSAPVQWSSSAGGNDHWYELSSAIPTSFDDAMALAASSTFEGQTGYLVSILSQAENDFLVATFGSSEQFYIGYTDQVTEGVWLWVSGETGSFTNWASGEPNNFNNEDFAVMNWQHESGPPQPAGAWNDLPGICCRSAIIEFNPVPEPASVALLGLGLAGLGFSRRKKA